MAIIKVGTGTFHQEHYPNSLTNSVHFSLSEDGSCFQELNQGHGVLFKKANIRPDNTLEELGCVQPVLTKRDDTYYIAARIVDAQGKPVICKADNNEQPSDESFEGQGENRADWEQCLVLTMERCCEAYELLPLVQDKAILDNILYSGVWVSYRGKEKRRARHDRRSL